jgi:hypothetical protein
MEHVTHDRVHRKFMAGASERARQQEQMSMAFLNPKPQDEDRPETLGPLTDQELRMWVVAAVTKVIAGGSPLNTLLEYAEGIYKFVNPPAPPKAPPPR